MATKKKAAHKKASKKVIKKETKPVEEIKQPDNLEGLTDEQKIADVVQNKQS